MIRVPVIFGRANKIGSAAIRLWTWSTWSHVGIVTKCGRYVIEAVAFKGVIKTPIEEFKKRYTKTVIAYAPIDKDIDEFYLELEDYLGAGYDYLAIFGRIFRRRWNSPNRWICSELFAIAANIGRPERISSFDPEDIWKLSK